MKNNNNRLIDTLIQIKTTYEQAITSGGIEATHSLIRSQKLISILHEYIKWELVVNGVAASKIFPPIGETSPEIKMSGFLKEKDQDISVLPTKPKPKLIVDGVLAGETDRLGKPIMNKSLCINIRSQLSSLSKNFDTLFERTFAESLNLHLRAQDLIMGEVFMVPLYAYDTKAIEKQTIKFGEKLPIKYLPAFKELNGRSKNDTDFHKYERICLLIVDFRPKIPKVINTTDALISEGFINKTEKRRLVEELTIDNFVSDLLEIYKARHGSIQPLK